MNAQCKRISEYYESYCLPKTTKRSGLPEVVLCNKSEYTQPVGGPYGLMRRQVASESLHAPPTQTRLPVYDEEFVATVYSEADRGTHRIKPKWQDPRWSDAMRAGNATLYDPPNRDPPNRGNWYAYRTTLTDAAKTPCQPLTVPDVHKLRYMHNNYMSADDWYDS